MIKFIRFATAALLCAAFVAHAAATGSKDEAQKLALAAAEHVKKVGTEQAFKDFSTKGGKWHDRDLYVSASTSAAWRPATAPTTR